MANSNVIELNGIAYDALTGEMLGTSQPSPSSDVVYSVPVKPMPSPRSRSHGTAVDGMLPSHQTRQAGNHNGRRPQATKTLMRQAVKPPHLKPKQTAGNIHNDITVIKSQANLQPKTSLPARAIHTKVSSDVIDPRRANRAAANSRSPQVSHFKTPANYAHRPQQQHVASHQAPAIAQARPAAPAVPQHPATQAHHDDQDIFQKALAQATSHQQPAPKQSRLDSLKSAKRSGRKRRALAIVGSLAIFVGLVGFVAFQNKTNIQLQMASAKAGFSAAIPLYKPDGYNMNKLDYGTGAVAMSYHNGDKGQFNIVQKKSNWDSQTLLENFVATTNEPYQGYQSNGRTIYVYGKGNATWVNGGIWYQIKDAKSLSNDQLVKVAASM